MKDVNIAYTWPVESIPAGASMWPRMVGRLTGHGESHYQFLPDYFCPHIILRGRGTVRTVDGEWAVESGDMFTLWPGVRIEYFEDPRHPWEYLWVHLIGPGAPGFVSTCGFGLNTPVLKAVKPTGVAERIMQIHHAFSLRQPDEACSVLANLYAMPPLCSASGAVPATSKNPQHELIARATSTLGTLLHTAINIKMLANMLQVSRVTLFRAFRQVLGKSPLEYLDQLRLAKAESLLLETRHPVDFVAKASGYANPKYFMRCFKTARGITPTAFRAKGWKG